jgi:hypothetical protein
MDVECESLGGLQLLLLKYAASFLLAATTEPNGSADAELRRRVIPIDLSTPEIATELLLDRAI